MSPAVLPETTTAAVAIGAMEERRWDRVRAIHQAGIDTGHATFAASGRCVYSRVAEVSVYVDLAADGRGVGTRVLSALIERSQSRDAWTLQAGIFPEDKASVALHEGLPFEVVGTRRRLGKWLADP